MLKTEKIFFIKVFIYKLLVNKFFIIISYNTENNLNFLLNIYLFKVIFFKTFDYNL